MNNITVDFGGSAGIVTYPPGYSSALADGVRCGEQGEQIEKWHDWKALANIIFNVHMLKPPTDSTSPLESMEYTQLTTKWKALAANKDITVKAIQEFRDFLQKIEESGWTVECSPGYAKVLKKLQVKQGTCPKATGSPPHVVIVGVIKCANLRLAF